MTSLRLHIAVSFLSAAVLLPASALAQTVPTPGSNAARPGTSGAPVPTPRSNVTPFSSDWAQPIPQTGGFFFNDPRLQGNSSPLSSGSGSTGRSTTCTRNPGSASGSCF